MTPKSKNLTRMAALLALTAIIQMIGLPQPITGPLINAILILSVLLIGPKHATAIGILTPVAALIRGHLPPVLAAMIPFIAFANAVYILLFYALIRNQPKEVCTLRYIRPIAGITLASLVKYVILMLTVQKLLPLIVGQDIPEKLMVMMMFPQLVTALVGGVLALLLNQYLVRSRE